MSKNIYDIEFPFDDDPPEQAYDAPPEPSARLPYLPGLDGLRALAVLAVLLYHDDLPWIPGGFLGVDVFFVISGFLITGLLLAEWDWHSHINLKAFWLRRARRLFPAAFLVIAATLAFAVVWLPDEVAGLRSDALASLAYVTNWYLILNHKSYFEIVGRPPLLQHLWSLAVEEQFYLLWPPLLIAGLRFWPRRRLLLAVLLGAAASTALMIVLYQPDVDTSRLYYGTDTRAAGLLIGAALALLWEACLRHGYVQWATPLLLDAIGLGALGALGWCVIQFDEYQSFLFQGGFTIVALLTAMVIAVIIQPRTNLGSWLLGSRVLRWVGKRSYGIYLWHWPVFVVTRPQLDISLDGVPLLALRLAATVVLAALSYRYVETPFRSGAIGRSWQTLRAAQGTQRRRLGLRWAGVAGTGAVSTIALAMAVAIAPAPAPPPYLAVEEVRTTTADAPTAVGELNDPIPSAVPDASPTLAATLGATMALTPAATMELTATPISNASALPTNTVQLDGTAVPVPTSTPVLLNRVTAIGDSVMVGAAWALERTIGDLDIDAAVNRQASAAIRILQARRAAGQLGEVVVVHIGTNGPMSARQFDEMMQTLSGVHQVVFVNVKAPRRWERSNNTVLAEGVKRYPNTILIDWHAASINHGELFWRDGIHLRPSGAQLYAKLLATRLKTLNSG